MTLRRTLRLAVLAGAFGGLPAVLDAQNDTTMAAPITAAVVARHQEVLAADSLRRRETPSPALERTARYVMAEFSRLGLQPGRPYLKDDSTWMQRYPMPGQQWVNLAESALGLIIRFRRQSRDLADEQGEPLTKLVPIPFASAAYFTPEVGQQTVARIRYNPFSGQDIFYVGKPLTLIAGRQTAATVRSVAPDLRDQTVLYVPAAGVDSAVRRQIITELYSASTGVIVVGEEDSARFAVQRASHQAPVELVERHMEGATDRHRWPWAVTASGAAMRAVLAASDEDLTEFRTDSTPIIRSLSTTIALISIDPIRSGPEVATAPNIVGVVEGRDPALQSEYLVLSTSMNPRNTAGIAGLLAIAQAFSKPEARPRRSIVFLATSGEAPQFAGANYFVHEPALPLASRKPIAANLTLDLFGGAFGDSIVIDGLRDVTVAPAPAPEWVVTGHPELGLRLVKGGTSIEPRSDHFAFARNAIPSFYLRAGDSEAAAPANAADVMRVSRLIFHISQAIANSDRRPQWTAAAREQLQSVIIP